MVWSLALCSNDAKQDPVVYGAEFGVVLLAEGRRTASVPDFSLKKGLDCLDRKIFAPRQYLGGRYRSTWCLPWFSPK